MKRDMENRGVSMVSTGVSDLAREKLREAVVAFGRQAFAEPRRCEAILRDLCPNAPREIFLLVSALRENVAAQLISQGAMPEEAPIRRIVSAPVGQPRTSRRRRPVGSRVVAFRLGRQPWIEGRRRGTPQFDVSQPAAPDRTGDERAPEDTSRGSIGHGSRCAF